MVSTARPELRGTVVPLYSGLYRGFAGTRAIQPKPAARARMMACARSETCSLVKMLEM
jgi:hypothetical protein